MRRVRRPVGAVRAGDLRRPQRQVHAAQHPPEVRETRLGLVVRHFVAGLVDAQEAEVAVLAHLSVVGAVDEEWCVARGSELVRVGVVDGQGDGFAAEPVADVICVAVDERNAHRVVEDHFEVGDEVWVGEVAGIGKCVVDIIVGLGIVEVDAECVLHLGLVEVVVEVGGRGGVIIGMSDIVDAAAAKLVVRRFDIGATLVSSLLAIQLANHGRAVDLTAGVYLSKAADVRHEAGELHVIVDGLVDELNAGQGLMLAGVPPLRIQTFILPCQAIRDSKTHSPIGIALSKLGVIGGLGVELVYVVSIAVNTSGCSKNYIKNAVYDSEGVESEFRPIRRAISDHLVLLVKIVEEGWAIMTAIGFCP